MKFVKKLGEDLSNSEAVIIGIAMTLCSGVLSLRQGSAGLERLDAHEGLSCTLGPRLDLEGLKEGGGPESEFPPLFHENPASRTFSLLYTESHFSWPERWCDCFVVNRLLAQIFRYFIQD